MSDTSTPPVDPRFTFATVTASGTPMMFVWDPEGQVIRYYDRRHPVQKGEPGYGINHFNEFGQCCGGARDADSFRPDATEGIRGWHEVDAWDLDPHTVRVVGTWLLISGFAFSR